jgi:hypothetical protein
MWEVSLMHQLEAAAAKPHVPNERMILKMLDWFRTVGPYDVPKGNYQRMKVAAQALLPKLEELKAARLVQEAIDAELAAIEKAQLLKEKAEAKRAREEARKKAREEEEAREREDL